MQMKKENVTEVIIGSVVVAIVAVAIIIYGTSDKVWYAGEHNAGCDTSENCGCYNE
jgi:hypothetical protein